MRRAGFLFVALLLGACGGEPPASSCRVGADAKVLAIGDSITRGYGADGRGYPEQLQGLLQAAPGRAGVKVVNMGVDGERSDGLLARIDGAIAANAPAVVLITTGGNDLLRRVDEGSVRSNLGAIVQRVRMAGAWPVVFAVPKPTLSAAVGLASDHELYQELADGGTRVIPDVVGDVLADDALRSDTIHPNASGYARMAQAAFDALSECR
jgi:lysophospholipase L1-like esterase